MRTTTVAQETALSARHRTTHVWIELENPDGVMVELTSLSGHDWMEEARIRMSADAPIGSATVTLFREIDGLSLAPLITGSTLNRDALSNYAPAIDFGRALDIYVATVLPGVTKATAAASRELLFRGFVDDTSWGGGSRIVIECRDAAGKLADRHVENLLTLGDDTVPVQIDDVMIDILEAVFGVGAVPLTVVGDPDFGIYAYELQNVTVIEALMKLADLQGWSLHQFYNDVAGDFQLTYYEPLRVGAVSTRTVGPDDYYNVSELRLNTMRARNAGELIYIDAAGVEQTITDERAGSADPKTRRLIRLDMRNSSIRDSVQATALLTAVMDDVHIPELTQRIDCAFLWPVEIGDLQTYSANGVHYDTNQSLAVFAYEHVLRQDARRTYITASGKPSGGYYRWVAREDPLETEPAPVSSLVPRERTLTTLNVTLSAKPATARIHYRSYLEGDAPTTPAEWLLGVASPVTITIPRHSSLSTFLQHFARMNNAPDETVREAEFDPDESADIGISSVAESPRNVAVIELDFVDSDLARWRLYAKRGEYPTTNGLADGPIDQTCRRADGDRNDENVVSFYVTDGTWYFIAVGLDWAGQVGLRATASLLIEAPPSGTLIGRISAVGVSLVDTGASVYVHRVTWHADATIVANSASYTVRVYERIQGQTSWTEITGAAIAATTETFDSPQVFPLAKPNGEYRTYEYRIDLIHAVDGVVQQATGQYSAYYAVS